MRNEVPMTERPSAENEAVMNARQVVERHFSARFHGYAAEARECLADDLAYSGPGARFDSAEAYLSSFHHVRRMTRRVEVEKVVADGNDVFIFYTIHVDHPATRELPIAEWFHLEEGTVVWIRALFDSAPFTAGEISADEQTSIDPLCGMVVRNSSAAAVRTREGTTYFFCSSSCAEQFETAPA